jgi:3',5'-cyclic AMP phosphodiesterase CpdA
MNSKKRLVSLVVILVCFIHISLAIRGQALSQQSEVNVIPPYAGFAEIDPTRDHFCIVSDTQKTSHWEFWRETNGRERKWITQEMANRDPAFIINLGDLTARGSSKKHWQEFDTLNTPLRERRIPYFPVMGNHEFYGNNGKDLSYFFGRFLYLDHRRWYSFIWKNIGFILLDSNFSDMTVEEVHQQTQWYLKELEKFEKDDRVDYIIAGCHRPPFTNSKIVRLSQKSQTYFAKPFLRFRKAVLFFSGHSHTYERFRFGGKLFIVTGGGGGPRHKVYVDPKEWHYEDLYAGPELRFFHFCEIEVTGESLLFTVHRLEADGTFSSVDPLTIPKPK